MSNGLTFDDAILLNDNERSESFTVDNVERNKYFKFNVVQGLTYEFTAFGGGDTFGHLYNESRSQISADDDSGGNRNPHIIYTATYTGVVYFMIRAYSSSYPTLSGIQALAREIVAPVGATFDTAIEITDDGTLLSGEISTSFPNVYFKINVKPNTFYVFQTRDANADLFAHSYNENRVELSSDDDSGDDNNPLINYRSNSDTTVYFMVRRRSSGSATFRAELKSIEIVSMDGDSPNNPILLDLNDMREDVFYPFMQTVYYRANLTVGEEYTLKVSGDINLQIIISNQNGIEIMDKYGYSDDGYWALDFKATTSIIRISLYTRITPNLEGAPFPIILTELDVTKVKYVNVEPYDSVVKLGETLQLTANVFPVTAIDKSVVWSSNDTSVATVDANGLVTPVKAGYAYISAFTNDGQFGNGAYVTVTLHEGLGTRYNPFLISNVEDLRKINSVIHEYYYYKQTNDIDFTGVENWEGIGGADTEFQGTYDGDNFRILNMNIVRDSHSCGFFNRTRYSEFKNIILENVTIIAGGGLGALAGYADECIVLNCHAIGQVTIEGNHYDVGGLIGRSEGSEIKHCSSAGIIKGVENVGGLIGSAVFGYGLINKCWSYADVEQVVINDFTRSGFGGLIGAVETHDVIDCYATGNVTGAYGVGGLIGRFESTSDVEVWNCFALGDVYGREALAGLIGTIPLRSGAMSITNVSDCYVFSQYIRDDGTSHEFATSAREFGDITSSPREFHISINNSYAVDDLQIVVTPLEIGELITTHARGRFARSQIMQQDLYQNWDFNRVWEFVEGVNHPMIRPYQAGADSPELPDFSEGISKGVLLNTIIFGQMSGRFE